MQGESPSLSGPVSLFVKWEGCVVYVAYFLAIILLSNEVVCRNLQYKCPQGSFLNIRAWMWRLDQKVPEVHPAGHSPLTSLLLWLHARDLSISLLSPLCLLEMLSIWNTLCPEHVPCHGRAMCACLMCYTCSWLLQGCSSGGWLELPLASREIWMGSLSLSC